MGTNIPNVRYTDECCAWTARSRVLLRLHDKCRIVGIVVGIRVRGGAEMCEINWPLEYNHNSIWPILFEFYDKPAPTVLHSLVLTDNFATNHRNVFDTCRIKRSKTFEMRQSFANRDSTWCVLRSLASRAESRKKTWINRHWIMHRSKTYFDRENKKRFEYQHIDKI